MQVAIANSKAMDIGVDKIFDTLAGAFLIWTAKQANTWIRSRRLSKFIFQERKIYEIQKRALALNTVNRWTIIRLHNGGKRLNVLKPKFYSMKYEDYDKGMSARFDNYQNVPVDRDMMALFTKVITLGAYTVIPEELDPTDTTRRVYSADNLKYSRMYYLFDHDAVDVYFMSYSSHHTEWKDMSEHDKSIMDLTAEQLKSYYIKNFS